MADMTREQAVEVLRLHNAWRRDKSEENPYPQQSPALIGRAIDFALTALTAQPAGEVVAWLCDAGDGENIDATNSASARDTYARSGRTIIPLYTHPAPQQPEQPADKTGAEPWYGHEFCKGRDGVWRCRDGCGPSLVEATKPDAVAPDQKLCEFYEVTNWPELVAAQEEHVLKLQDAARRNVKPWEDTFPPTLLPKYLRETGLAATEPETKTVVIHTSTDQPGAKVRGLVEKWEQEAGRIGLSKWGDGYITAMKRCFGELKAALSAKGENEDTTNER